MHVKDYCLPAGTRRLLVSIYFERSSREQQEIVPCPYVELDTFPVPAHQLN